MKYEPENCIGNYQDTHYYDWATQTVVSPYDQKSYSAGYLMGQIAFALGLRRKIENNELKLNDIQGALNDFIDSADPEQKIDTWY